METTLNTIIEEIKVLSHELADKVKSLISEANVNRIIIKDDHGNTFVEIPVFGSGGRRHIRASGWPAVAALAAMASKFTVVVEKKEPKAEAPPEQPKQEPKTETTSV